MRELNLRTGDRKKGRHNVLRRSGFREHMAELRLGALAVLLLAGVAPPAVRAVDGGDDLASAAAAAVEVQRDGKIIAAGSVRADGASAIALARYNLDGSLDRSFGFDGRVVTAFRAASVRVSAMAIGNDRRIVVAGTSSDDKPDRRGSRQPKFALARYGPDGLLDKSFSNNGKLTTRFTDRAVANALAVAPGGKIIAAGFSSHIGRNTSFALARYRPDGSLDRGFADNGRRTTDFTVDSRPRNDVASAIALQPDGRIVLAGESSGGGGSARFALARYRSEGALDRAFAGDGKLVSNVCELGGASDVVVQGDGKIVAGGPGCGFLLARFNGNGALDSSFGDAGKVVTDFDALAQASAVTLQPDGRLVAAGWSEPEPHVLGDFALARYELDGSLEDSFGTAGRVTTSFGPTDAFSQMTSARDVDVAPGAKLVAAGHAGTGTFAPARFAAARYEADGGLDTGFGDDGTLLTAFTRRDLARADHAITVGVDGRYARVDKRRVHRVVACPPSEVTPPCAGKLTLKTAHKVRFRGDTRRVVLATGRFSLTDGEKHRVVLRLSNAEVKLLRDNERSRRVTVSARVRDGAGNKARVVKRTTLRL
jgi:uncharacterized delta-60 repeat protein